MSGASRSTRWEFSQEVDLVDLNDELIFQNNRGKIRARPFSSKRLASASPIRTTSRPTSVQFWGQRNIVDRSESARVRKQQLFMVAPSSAVSTVSKSCAGELPYPSRARVNSPLRIGGRSTIFASMYAGNCSPSKTVSMRQKAQLSI
jgi:hypothetical protein